MEKIYVLVEELETAEGDKVIIVKPVDGDLKAEAAPPPKEKPAPVYNIHYHNSKEEDRMWYLPF